MYNLIKLQKHASIFMKLQNRNQSWKMLKSKKSKSGRRKCSIKCFNDDYAMQCNAVENNNTLV